MVEADPVMRAARNGFGGLMVAILGLWAFRFATGDGSAQQLFDLLLLGGFVYWGSQLYYRRQRASREE
jgi:Zn-dependent protease with chaperone function